MAAARYALITLVPLLIVAVYRRVLHVNQTTVALTFIVLVLLVATRWRLAYSVYLSLLCTLLYNFFFLAADRHVVDQRSAKLGDAWGISCGQRGGQPSGRCRERRAAAQSEARREDVERLFEFSEQLLMHDDLPALARTAPSLIASIFKLAAVALYVRQQGQSVLLRPEQRVASIGAARGGGWRSRNRTCQRMRRELRVVPLALGMQSSGVLAMTVGDYAEGMYEAIAGLMAIALERAAALASFSHIEASREGERLRSALLDSVTHELRTPLTAIRAAATMLISQPQRLRESRPAGDVCGGRGGERAP